MGLLISPELSLDCRSTSKAFGEIWNDISTIHSLPDKISKISDYLNRLRDEMKKIDGFKRELPLCMMLVNDAIFAMNEELTQCQRSYGEPVLEEFIPLKDNNGVITEIESDKEKEKDVDCSTEKKSWMSSVQLYDYSNNFEPVSNPKKRSKEDDANGTNTNELLWSWRNSTGGRAFVPFNLCPANVMGNENGVELVGVTGLSLGAPVIKRSISFTTKSSCNGSGLSLRIPEIKKPIRLEPSYVVNGKSKPKSFQKQRRRWSPELHRRFLFALQRLGGSKVATPKQIRELMQVDNLTNDEVKSHLQKYRLHNQRICLLSNEELGESSKQSNSSGSPHGPLGMLRSTSGASITEGYSTEDEEENEKLESHNWKTSIHLSLKR